MDLTVCKHDTPHLQAQEKEKETSHREKNISKSGLTKKIRKQKQKKKEMKGYK